MELTSMVGVFVWIKETTNAFRQFKRPLERKASSYQGNADSGSRAKILHVLLNAPDSLLQATFWDLIEMAAMLQT